MCSYVYNKITCQEVDNSKHGDLCDIALVLEDMYKVVISLRLCRFVKIIIKGVHEHRIEGPICIFKAMKSRHDKC